MSPALLLAALLSAGSPQPDVLTVPRPSGPEWLGVYLVGKKAGWARFEVGRERREGQDVLVATSEIQFRVTVGGKQVERRQRDQKVYQARPGGSLLAFRSERSGDGGNRTVEGSCTPRACRARLAAEGSPTQVRELPPMPETAEQADAFRLAAARRSTVAGAMLDLEQLKEKKVQDVFQRRERLGGAGVEVPVSVVAESEPTDRLPAVYLVADDGRVVEVRWGESLVARAEPEAVARRLDKVDLFNLSRVSLPGLLPQSVPGRIRFVMHGLPRAFQVDDARQKYRPAGSGEVEVTVSARPAGAEDPARDARRPVRATGETAALLAATPEVDADDPLIRRTAAEVVGGTRGVYAASRKILDFVHRRLDKVYGQSRDRASEVLASGKGDCTEHALLFLALARAAGIPARGVHGLVYARYADGVPALYWHAWVEVRSGPEWIAMDPTFGQPVADATHVTLGRGTQADAVGLLGALTVARAEPLAP
jgi:transglutaminase-like putative cysteine protease